MGYYKTVNSDGIILSVQSCSTAPKGAISIEQDTYQNLLAVMRSKPTDTLESVYKLSDKTETYVAYERNRSETVDWYYMEVVSGRMAIDEVPEEYQAEVKALLPEEPNNDYGVSDETYNAIIDDYTLSLMENGLI